MVTLPGSEMGTPKFSEPMSLTFVVFRHINFSDATPDELEQLAQACEPASFGMHHEQVLDESYRKAGKMDSECFASTLDLVRTDLVNIIRDCLLEGTRSTKNIKAELYKLNVYGTRFDLGSSQYLIPFCCPGKGSFFKPHVDTPRSEKMFGSLVVVFPTFHEGGALFLRHRGHEWIFDSGQALTGAANNHISIGYVAFFSDIEHEIAPVTSGHRVTLTYNLYFDDRGPVSEKDAVSEHLIPPRLPNQEGFHKAFERLLENAEFMAEGGTLGFGLRHVYPIKRDLKHVHNILKGSDAVVYQRVRALGFEPVLYVYYDDTFPSNSPPTGVIVDQLSGFGEGYEEQISQVLQDDYGGIIVRQDGGENSVNDDYYHSRNHEVVEWVTPVTVYNRQKGAYVYLGNEASLGWAYGDVCMMVRIGKAGDRLGYPTVAQVKKAYERGRDD
jgi:hypothetical protein